MCSHLIEPNAPADGPAQHTVGVIEQLRGRLVVSCQAPPGHPLADVRSIVTLCECAERGGAAGVRVAYASGPALAVRYETVSGIQSNGELRLVAARARDGDELARYVLREGAEFLGRAIGGIVNLLDPELVVFGGGLADLDAELFWCHTIRTLQAEVRAGVPIPCLPARLRNDAAMIGAALVAGTKVNLN